MSEALIRRLKLPDPVIALSGGLLMNDNLYQRMVREKISAFARVVRPENDALHGAVMLALEAMPRL